MNSYKDINEAWYQSCRACLVHGERVIVDRGSFEGTIRAQLPAMAFEIKWPWSRPLEVVFQGDHVITQCQIEEYFTGLLMSEEMAPNQSYTYGSRLVTQLPKIIDMLSRTPQTNQAIAEIARPEDIDLDDPPCLRSIAWGTVGKKLNISCFFRSWDVAQGLPSNLGGIQLLNEYVAEMTGLSVGRLYAYCSAAHVYVDNFVWF